jgi:hypothetical protein
MMEKLSLGELSVIKLAISSYTCKTDRISDYVVPVLTLGREWYRSFGERVVIAGYRCPKCKTLFFGDDFSAFQHSCTQPDESFGFGRNV